MKKINILYSAFAILVVTSIASCKKEPIVGGTAVQSLAGEWWVKIDDGKNAGFGPGYYNFSTYNTAANVPTEMWVDDDNNAKSFWDIKGKVTTNVATKTFSGANIANQDYKSTFTITNGKIIPNGARASATRDVTDSIYFQIQFSDDSPIVTHTVTGYKRTGFSQDDH